MVMKMISGLNKKVDEKLRWIGRSVYRSCPNNKIINEFRENVENIIIKRRLVAIGEEIYHHCPQIQRFSSYNYVYKFDFGGKIPDKIVKYAHKRKGSFLIERQIMTTLRDADLAVPEIEHTEDTCSFNKVPFIVMPKVAESDLGKCCKGNTKWAYEAFEKAGRFAAQLHSLDPGMFKSVGIEQRAKANNKRDYDEIVAYLARLGVLSGGGDRHLNQVDRLLRECRGSLIHGDYSVRQVLADESGSFAVVDWETIAPGSSNRDLGRFEGSVNIRGGDVGLVQSFFNGFEKEKGLSGADLEEIREWKIYSFLDVSRHFSLIGREKEAARILNMALSELGVTKTFSGKELLPLSKTT